MKWKWGLICEGELWGIFILFFPFPSQRRCTIEDICPKNTLNPNLVKTCLRRTYFVANQSFWKFAQSRAVFLPCSVQNQDDWTIKTDVMDKQDFARFELKILFRCISYIEQGPWCLYPHIPLSRLTSERQETHGWVVSTVATDVLVLKHQAISIHNADYTFIVLDQFHMKILHLWCTTLENKTTFWKKNDPVV